ncbi:hypothetical protein GKE82_08945 [Conexibacter sp. W3-3-2]|uniref:DUF6416 domain-containing protein n=1 Tax=Conexibacter sp. W3-3-2 TaxID=2675227 RepID=UPI0012B94DB3|nr:DUF6416 domain-containing protein [Conexibacter sp. W3-3-2]MTD44413.1 hypothetical protein [Conexibacter sp. W3-3-2]
MADKAITVDVPEDRVPEFYLWFAAFLASEPGAPVPGGRPGPGRGGPFGPGGGEPGHRRRRGWVPPVEDAAAWTADDTAEAAWLYGKLAPPARALFDALLAAPGTRIAGNDLAARLGLEKGAHGVAGILAWPGRYCRKLGRVMPVSTAGRDDGGTDYYMEPEVAAVFAAAVSAR